MNSQSSNRPYAAPRPAPAFRPGRPMPQARPLQEETPMENDMTQPAAPDAMPAAPGTVGIAVTPAAVVPPIPPLPLLPVPYDYNAEGLTTKEGRLVRVESNAYVLQDESSGNSQVCDYYSLKFFRCLGEGSEH